MAWDHFRNMKLFQIKFSCHFKSYFNQWPNFTPLLFILSLVLCTPYLLRTLTRHFIRFVQLIVYKKSNQATSGWKCIVDVRDQRRPDCFRNDRKVTIPQITTKVCKEDLWMRIQPGIWTSDDRVRIWKHGSILHSGNSSCCFWCNGVEIFAWHVLGKHCLNTTHPTKVLLLTKSILKYSEAII